MFSTIDVIVTGEGRCSVRGWPKLILLLSARRIEKPPCPQHTHTRTRDDGKWFVFSPLPKGENRRGNLQRQSGRSTSPSAGTTTAPGTQLEQTRKHQQPKQLFTVPHVVAIRHYLLTSNAVEISLPFEISLTYLLRSPNQLLQLELSRKPTTDRPTD